MRIVSGTHGGRTVTAPKGLPVRPTTDFAKEALFNILQNRYDFETLKVLDLFSGIGNISYEFASRGAKQIIAVDSHYQCCAFIKETNEKLGFKNITVLKSDAFQYLKRCNETFDIIFADPPFDMLTTKEIPSLVFEKTMLNPGGCFILEHSDQLSFAKTEHFLEQRNYSRVNFSIFK